MKTDYFFGVSSEGFHRVAYREWGQANPDDVPVICVHGMTRNGRDFDILASFLSKLGKHVFCPDVAGRGDSDWLKKANYTFEQYVTDMNTLIARTGASQVDWIGTSMGGLIGMIMASLPNSPIRRLIINDIGPQIPVAAIHRLAKYTGRDPEFKSIEEAKNYYRLCYASFGELTDDQWLRITMSTIKEAAPNRYVSKVDPSIKHIPNKGRFLWNLITHPYKTLQGILFDINLWHVWQHITCPVYLIHGNQSDLLLPDVITRMQKTHPAMEILTIPKAGHAPTLETREELDRIDKWLSP